MERALITGVGGQDGWFLSWTLHRRGVDVHGMIRTESSVYRQRLQDELPFITLHFGDLSDRGSLSHVVSSSSPDAVFNLAAVSSVALSFERPELAADVNGTGAVRLLEAVRTDGRPSTRFFQASSSEMFGSGGPRPFDETAPFRPQSPYAASKVFSHHMSHVYRTSFGMHVSCGIMFNHDSERRPRQFVTRKVSHSVARIALGLEHQLVLGNLDVARDWGYAADHVEAMVRMVERDEPDDYVVATGEMRSLRDLVATAFQHVGISDWEQYVVTDPSLLRPSDLRCVVGDASKARRELRWEPEVSFREMVGRMVESDLEALSRRHRRGRGGDGS